MYVVYSIYLHLTVLDYTKLIHVFIRNINIFDVFILGYLIDFQNSEEYIDFARVFLIYYCFSAIN